MTTARELFPAHRAELHASGLTNATIKAAGIYSESDQRALQHLLGWTKPPKKLGAAIVYPYHSPDGTNGYARIKPDSPRKREGKAVKYESPKGRPNEVYFPSGTVAAVDDASISLAVTEGEKKALAADQNGLPCIGLVGVWGWKPAKHERLLPGLERIAWQGRKVYIAFDSDYEDKPDVQAAESRLAAVLARYGAIVRCVRLPSEPDGAKNGIDDFIVRHGANELHRLIAEAVEPDPVDGDECQRLACTLEPRDEIAKMLKSVEQDGVSRLRYWRGTYWWWSNGRYVEQDVDEVRSQVVSYLNPTVNGLNTTIVGNHLMQLRAQARIAPATEPPAWLGEPGWAPNEMLACKNELVHLPSYLAGEANYRRAATPTLFNTAALGFNFDPKAAAPEHWQRFLDGLWADDPDSPDVLREWFGYCLTPDTSQHKILMIVGPPRSGKGTVARVLRELVGRSNVAGPTLSSLATDFGLSPLVGKSLAVISDARLGGRSDIVTITERLLAISGEDALTIDRKYLEPITCTLPTRFVILTNELPRFTDASGALASRMIVLRLTRSWLGSEDHQLSTRLLTELPGILLWAITGWRRLRDRGRFQEPAASADMRQQLNDLTSPIKVFIRSCCDVGPGEEVIRSDLYDAYAKWAESQGTKHVDDQQGFGRHLRAALPELSERMARDSVKKMRRRYVGIGLKPPSEM